MTSDLSIGVSIRASGDAVDVGALRALASVAEGLGFSTIWVSDHVVIPVQVESPYPYAADGKFRVGPTGHYFEVLTVLSWLAGFTTKIRLGTSVLIIPQREPVLMAKQIATLDNLSGGRIDLGIGVGWLKEEFEALGVKSFTERGAVTDEQIRVMKALWTEETPSFDGKYFKFPPIGAHPHPIQFPHPPIWVGGHTKAAIRRAARLGDGWLPIGGRPPAVLPPEEVAAGVALLREEATKAGRDPSALKVCFSTNVSLNDAAGSDAAGPPSFHGSPDQVAATIQTYRKAGVDSFIFNFGNETSTGLESRMRRFVDEVKPALR